MKKVQNLSKYVKTHKLVSLGIVASAAALVATGIGTYSYFSDSKTANTNITLNKGTVTLGEVSGVAWNYLGNSTDTTSNPTSIDKISDISLKDGVTSEPSADYSGKVVNPDLTDSANTTLNSYISNHTSNVPFSSASFSNIVPGDMFRKTYDIQYTGSNSAEVTVGLNWGASTNTDWTKFNKYYNYIVEYSVVETKDNNQVNIINPINLFSNYKEGAKVSDYATFVNKGYLLTYTKDSKDAKVLLTKNQILKITVSVKLKNSADYPTTSTDTNALTQNELPTAISSTGTDGFKVTVKNHLEAKPVSTTNASN